MTSNTKVFYFGADYYPEHWPQERWAEDAKLMAEAGFNIVRLAEFAWSRMEPADGIFDFTWLDEAIDILQAQNIQIVLGTPTASAPPWLMAKSHELFLVDKTGTRLTYGNRRNYCPQNRMYHDYTRRVVREMARHYADHPAVLGWQIDNEFGDRCYCPICQHTFQEWLCRRYESLDALNEKWGTIFWSHVYTDWSQIPVPLETGKHPNPGLALDFYRFSSDSYVAYQQMQVDILREECPDHFITHDFMGFNFDQIDYFDLAGTLDFVSCNQYRRTQFHPPTDADFDAIGMDTMRGLKHQNFWMTEQQSGPGSWQYVGNMPRPGELRLWTYQSIAHGADAIIYFRWRPARYGAEQFWYGILNHDGSTSRRYDEIKQTGLELKRCGSQIKGTVIRANVALVLSYDSRFAFQIQPNNEQFSYSRHVYDLYKAFSTSNIPVDIVAPTDDLSPYRLVVAPALYVVSDEIRQNFTQYVEQGGSLALTPRSGVKDMANAVVNQPLPGILSELAGVEVEDFDSLLPGASNALALQIPALAALATTAHTWCDILKPTGAEVVATYTRDYYAGKPAVTLNRVGQGRVLYIGTFADHKFYGSIMKWLLDTTVNLAEDATPEGVEIAVRWNGMQQVVFVLNYTAEAQLVNLKEQYTNLLDGASLSGGVTLPPYEVLILQTT